MHDLKSSRLVAPHSRCMAHIPCLPFKDLVLHHNVRRLEDADWERVAAILPDRLEEPGEKGRAHDLEFERLGVGNLDGLRAIVHAV